ncbi:Cystathionine gamma-synthase [Pleurostoma richardsiae]|uniref:cystathionine gamma-synthase n=1 Tax=Pleurostoma richardsiae TaxID=41990 RepID=A0AA38RNX7_9PEZI|nr:Cystathionine gamma-synthase [Pleurostoma richardsiae]
MPTFELGESIPADTAHAVSVSLPTWRANVGYEEGEQWVMERMTTGYPRFFIHRTISGLAQELARQHGQPGQEAMLFPSRQAALRCAAFIKARAPPALLDGLHTIHLTLDRSKPAAVPLLSICPAISAVLFSSGAFSYAKQYWQHTGDGVSSRRAEFCSGLLKDGLLVLDDEAESQAKHKFCRGPRRYRRPLSVDDSAAWPSTQPDEPRDSAPGVPRSDADETYRFLEERFGRNLDISFVERAKSAIRRRIAGTLTADVDVAAGPLPEKEISSRGVKSLEEGDIYLYPCGMNAVFNAHRTLLAARGNLQSINFGFPYVDSLKILQKFGPGCIFYGHASDGELDDLERRLEAGERFLGLFCEFPGNPLLTCPDLARIRSLADRYNFALVVDETIGTFANINVLQYADIVVSSLTKIFSGDCNVMGGSAVLNPEGRYYSLLKSAADALYEDTYWCEDAIFMERNSRDFAARIERINANAEAICDVLHYNPLVKQIYYPKYNDSRKNYDACRLTTGGYGGLLSVTFHRKAQAMAFYDALETAKGPSLGTNFTLTSPYVLLAHYQELDWAASLGVDPDLIRISVGLEETDQLKSVFVGALDVAAQESTVEN